MAKTKNSTNVCSVDGCEREFYGRGFCHFHWTRNRRGTRMDAPQRTVGLALKERLLGRIEYDTNGGCWLWGGYLTPLGYGKIGAGRGVSLTHRIAWRLFRGDPGALCVCHRCDVPACCNPDHLFLGTKADNSADMVAKGRDARGERSGGAKLTEGDVLALRQLGRSGQPQSVLAEQFGVSQQLVSLVIRGKRWAHLPHAK